MNACVSHELRNPLNSIVAQDILKKQMYKKLKKVAKASIDQENGNLIVPADLRLKILNEQVDLILKELNCGM